MIRQYIHQHAPEKNDELFGEKRFAIFIYLSVFNRDGDDVGCLTFRVMQLKEEQKFLIGMFEQLRNDPIVVSYRQERAHLTSKKSRRN